MARRARPQPPVSESVACRCGSSKEAPPGHWIRCRGSSRKESGRWAWGARAAAVAKRVRQRCANNKTERPQGPLRPIWEDQPMRAAQEQKAQWLRPGDGHARQPPACHITAQRAAPRPCQVFAALTTPNHFSAYRSPRLAPLDHLLGSPAPSLPPRHTLLTNMQSAIATRAFAASRLVACNASTGRSLRSVRAARLVVRAQVGREAASGRRRGRLRGHKHAP